jgi:DNA helicase HerA-like ATPase
MTRGKILSPTKITEFDVESHGLHYADFVKFYVEGQPVLGQVIGMERFPDKIIAKIGVLGFQNDNKIKLPSIPPRPGDDILYAGDSIIREVLHSPENGIYIGLLRDHKIRIRLSPDVLLNRHLALLAMTGAGKSYTAGVIMEELMLRRYPLVVVDVSNEYTLMANPNTRMSRWNKFRRYPRGFPQNILTIEGWSDKCRPLIKKGRMLIINIHRMPEGDQPAIVRDICDSIFEWRCDKKIPQTFLVIEETHKFAPQRKKNMSSDSVIRVLSEGRKYGLGCCVISQRPGKLDKNVLSQCWTQILHKVTNPNDLKTLEQSAERAPKNFIELLQTLAQGEALIIGGGLNFTAVTEIREKMSGYK